MLQLPDSASIPPSHQGLCALHLITTTQCYSKDSSDILATRSVLLQNNLLHHTLQHLVVEFPTLVARELDILGQVVRQDFHELAIPRLVKQWLVRELCLFVRLA